MAYTRNKAGFLRAPQSDSMVSAYRMLVAIELALKDSNFLVGGSGHDVPGMLGRLATSCVSAPLLAAQVNAMATTLKRSLGQITSQGKDGLPMAVPTNNYPVIRYSRRVGDWGGVSETPDQIFVDLENECRGLCAFLAANARHLGVVL